MTQLTAENLREGQLALLEQMEYFPDGIAVLDMGDGKTGTTLFAVRNLLAAKEISRAVVFAPPNTLRTAWAKEPSKWKELAHLKVAILDGPRAYRQRCLEEGRHDIYVMSTNVIQWWVGLMHKWSRRKNKPWSLQDTMLVIDEISQMSDPMSKRGNKLLWATRQAAGTWGLTGTPRPKKYEQLFLPIKLVGGSDIWGPTSFTEWRRENFMPMDYHGYTWKPFPHAVREIEHIAQTFMFTAPPRTTDKVEVMEHDHYIDLAPVQREHYDTMMEELIAEGVDLSGDEWDVEAFSRGVASGKLVQIVQGFLYRDGERPVQLAWQKLDKLKELDDQLGGAPTMVVYGLLEELDQLRAHYDDLGMSTGVLGNAATGKNKQRTIEAWQAGKIDRLICHPASMGHGTDGLQEAGHQIVWYHPTWSSERYWQTVKRLARPGQKHEVVHSHRILARDTLDLFKVRRVEHDRKEELAFIERMSS